MEEEDDDALRDYLLSWTDEAVAYLFRKYYSRLVRTAYFWIRDSIAAEDIVQQSFADFWLQYEKICAQTSTPIIKYLFGIVKNKSADFFNKNKAHLNYEFNFDTLPNPLAEQKELTEFNHDRRVAIWTILSTFPRREKQSLIMKYYLKMSVKEIAAHMNVTTSAVERSITAAYKRFRQYRSHFR